MSTNIPISPPSLTGQPHYSNGDALWSSDQGSNDNARLTSVTIPIPKEIDFLISTISSSLDKLALVGQYIGPIFIVVCAVTAILKSVGQLTKDVLFAVFFTALFGGFAWPVWSILRRVQCQLDDVFEKIDALQQSIKHLESTPINHLSVDYPPVDLPPVGYLTVEHPPVEHPPIDHIPIPRIPIPPIPNDSTVLTREDPTSESIVHPIIKPTRPISLSANAGAFVPGKKISIKDPSGQEINIQSLKLASPSAVSPTPPPPPSTKKEIKRQPIRIESQEQRERRLAEERAKERECEEKSKPVEDRTALEEKARKPVGSEPPVTTEKPPYRPFELPGIPQPDRISENRPPSESVRPTFSGFHYNGDVTLESPNNIVGVSDTGTAGGSAQRPAVIPESTSSHWLSTLREIKQRIEQFTEGGFERTSHLDQSEPPNHVQLRRCGVRLLMSSASLSPADFASPVGFLGPSESTPYYPTGDLQKDRMATFTTAMDCLDHMDVHVHGSDSVKIAATLFELAQALSDLGLHKYALDISGFALATLERASVATHNPRCHIASILSLRANILHDLKQNDEAIDAAHRAVTLIKEHRDSQTTPVPDLAPALLNYAVLLNSIGLKDESAAVAFELLGEVDESQPDMKDVAALCNLCLSNVRFGNDDGTDLSTTEEAIGRTRASSGAISQTILSGALLNKSKILSSKRQNEAAIPFSAEAVTLLRGMSATRPVFFLFLAHALDTHAHHLSEAGQKGDSYSIRQDAVELWQTLKVSAPDPIARPLAWSFFELAKFRHKNGERNTLREELRIAECAVDAFRGVEPLDLAGLGDALYLFADRMLELDENREAATYAEESVQYFREASAGDQKYALDLIFSLSLASSCLACTERGEDALEYAKQAVEVQRGRKGGEDKQYDAHLRWLLMDVVYRAMEMSKEHEARPWFEELQALDGAEPGDPRLRRRSLSQDNGEEFKKQTSLWMDPNTDAPRQNKGYASPAPGANSSTRTDKSKGGEVAPSPKAQGSTAQGSTAQGSTAQGSTAQVTKGKAKEVNALSDLSTPGHASADEEILSPGAAAQRRLADIGSNVNGRTLGGYEDHY